MSTKSNLVEFDKVWNKLEVKGYCDGHGGCEYHRVSQDWLKSDKKEDIAKFIRREANRI